VAREKDEDADEEEEREKQIGHEEGRGLRKVATRVPGELKGWPSRRMAEGNGGRKIKG